MKRKIPHLDKPYAKHRALSDEERDLWHGVFSGKFTEKPKAKAKPAQKPAAAATVKTPPVASPPPTRIEKPVYSRIKRGAVRIDATLDLHGQSREGAYTALLRFMEKALAEGARTLLIITGKGKSGSGALKESLPRWLRETPLRESIIAYDTAGSRHGGAGAWYVRIRRPKPERR